MSENCCDYGIVAWNYCPSCGKPKRPEPRKSLGEKLRDVYAGNRSWISSYRDTKVFYDAEAQAALDHFLDVVNDWIEDGGYGYGAFSIRILEKLKSKMRDSIQ